MSISAGNSGTTMILAGEAKFLRERLESNIRSFQKRLLHNKRIAFLIRMIIVCLGTLTTILLGIRSHSFVYDGNKDYLAAMAFSLSAVIPIFAAWEAFFDHRWLWVRYRLTLDSLYAISDDLEYMLVRENAVTKDELKGLHLRLQQVLQETSSAWFGKREKEQASDDRNTSSLASSRSAGSM
jgi:hypothetical protein